MRKLKMLVVDDDPLIVQLIITIIDKSQLSKSLEWVAFTDSEDAINWLDDNGCDLVLTDFEMPKYVGVDILRKAKKRNIWTQVVFLTAHSMMDRMSNVIESGASDYLVKPLNHKEIIEVLGQIVDRMQRWQTIAHKALVESKTKA
jgi:YesN/AraC family two-component response regulator